MAPFKGPGKSLSNELYIFVKFAKVRYYFVLPLDGDPQTMCCSGPTNLDPPCTEAPPNPVRSESLAM